MFAGSRERQNNIVLRIKIRGGGHVHDQLLNQSHYFKPHSYKAMDLALPAEMVEGIEAFKEFYEGETKHRKLQVRMSLMCVYCVCMCMPYKGGLRPSKSFMEAEHSKLQVCAFAWGRSTHRSRPPAPKKVVGQLALSYLRACFHVLSLPPLCPLTHVITPLPQSHRSGCTPRARACSRAASSSGRLRWCCPRCR